jgi:exodeoxyribonuclease-5
MNYTFTKEQQAVIDAGVYHLKHSSDQVFEFEGPAGTGKSVVLNAILERSGIAPHRVAPMAFIGQAAIVMRLKGMRNAKTIHSWLYEPVEQQIIDSNNRLVIDPYYNRPKYRLTFVPKPLTDIDCIFIDEGGSVPAQVSGGEGFGGLNIKQEIESRGKKIIVAGDLGQLPPVGGRSAYLDPYNPKLMHLTEIMRQGEGSPIVFLADRARKGLPIHKGFYGNVLVIDESELTDDMVLHSDVLLCGKNVTRDRINLRVRRDILGIRSDFPKPHEKLVCRKNNWTIETGGINLANGLSGTVVNHPNIDSFDGKTFSLDFRPMFMDVPFMGLRVNYEYMNASKEARDMLRNMKSEGEKFEYAYALTTHMAQGNQFSSGIYMEEYMAGDIQRNLNYTGITRFVNSMIYVLPRK